MTTEMALFLQGVKFWQRLSLLMEVDRSRIEQHFSLSNKLKTKVNHLLETVITIMYGCDKMVLAQRYNIYWKLL